MRLLVNIEMLPHIEDCSKILIDAFCANDFPRTDGRYFFGVLWIETTIDFNNLVVELFEVIDLVEDDNFLGL